MPKPHPVDGDVILHCGHLELGTLSIKSRKTGYHWYHDPDGTSFMRPDRTTGVSHWTVVCNQCHSGHIQTGKALDIRGDGIYLNG